MNYKVCVINITEIDITVCYFEGEELCRFALSQLDYKLKGSVSFDKKGDIVVNSDITQPYLGSVKNFLRYPGRNYSEIYHGINLSDDLINLRLVQSGEDLYFVVNEEYNVSLKSVFIRFVEYVVEELFLSHLFFSDIVVCVPRHYSEAEFNVIKHCFGKLEMIPIVIHDYAAIVSNVLHRDNRKDKDQYYAIIHSKYFSTDLLIVHLQNQNEKNVLTVLESRELMNISNLALVKHIVSILRYRYSKLMNEGRNYGLEDMINLTDDFWIKKENVAYRLVIPELNKERHIGIKVDYNMVEMFLRQSGYASLFLTHRMLDSCGINFKDTVIVAAGLFLQSSDFLADRDVFALEDRIIVLDDQNYLFWGSRDSLLCVVSEEGYRIKLPMSIWFYSSEKSYKLLLEKGSLLPQSNGCPFIPSLKKEATPVENSSSNDVRRTMKFALVSSEKDAEEGKQAVLKGEGKILMEGEIEFSLPNNDVDNIFYMHLTVTHNFSLEFTINHLSKNTILFQNTIKLEP